MASIADSIKKQLKAARKEYRAKRAELESALVRLDREYAFVIGDAKPNGAGERSRPGKVYGGVRSAVLGAIKAAKGIKPKQIAEKTGLASAQIHNSLTGLKKGKLVRVKDGLCTSV